MPLLPPRPPAAAPSRVPDLPWAPLTQAALYVHVPFCAYRCRYCDFYFETGWSDRVLDRTLEALEIQARTWWEALGRPAVPSLYFGGGTPGIISPERFVPWMERWRSWLKPWPGEVSLEANPENVVPESLAAWAQGGVNRLSLGIQTFDDPSLHLLGRWADRRRCESALNDLARHWRGRWSADLITGLPGTAWTQVQADLERLSGYGPRHLSLYSLTLEPDTPLDTLVRQGQVKTLDPDHSDILWIQARDWLQDRGWDWYEISNFSRDGDFSRHNAAYWQLDPYLGIGPGAHGTLFTVDPAGGPLRPCRTEAPKLFPWLSGTAPSVEQLSPRAFLTEHLLTGLRTRRGLGLARLSERFPGLNLAGFIAELQALWGTNLHDAALSAGRLALSDPGRLTLDSLLSRALPVIDRALAAGPTA